MIDPYRMVVVGVVSSFILGAAVFIYTYIYPKKKPNLLYLLVLISILPLISILRKGSYESGDLSLHVKFAMQFYDNLAQGNIIPQWMGNHCATYGCPVYIFIFPLPYYLISLFHFIGFTFIDSVKLLIITTFITSGIGVYLWIKNELGKIPAFVSSIFFLFAPYHLLDMHFRVSIGEMTSMAILPFVFLITKLLVETNKLFHFLLTSLALALLILSHQATALMSFPFLIIYSILVWQRNKQKKFAGILFTFFAFAFGICLTAFYWLPVLSEGKYTYFIEENSIAFHPISSFIYSSNRFGLLFQGHMGEYYLNVGYTQWIIVIFSIYLLFKKKIKGNDRKLYIYFLCSFLLLFIFMQSFTKPVWDYFPFFRSIQFSWRLLIETSLFVAVIAGIVAKNIKSKTFISVLCTITILYTMLNWGNRKMEPNVTDEILRPQPLFQEQPGSVDLTTPVWVNRNAKWVGTYPKKHIEILSEKATAIQTSRRMTEHIYNIVVKEDSIIKENTFYFPGWKLFVNDKEQTINYQNKEYEGVITFPLKKGAYHVKLIFTNTPIRAFAQGISAFTAAIFIILLSITIKSLIFKKIAKLDK